MTFSRANALGWALYEVLTSAQENTIDVNASRAIDGYAGGTYNPSAGLTWNHTIVVDASGATDVEAAGVFTGWDLDGVFIGAVTEGAGILCTGGSSSHAGWAAAPGIYAVGGDNSSSSDGGNGVTARAGSANGGDGGTGVNAWGGASTNASGGNGIFGKGGSATATNTPGIGVYGIGGSGGNGHGYGIHGQGTGDGVGVYGKGGSTDGIGVHAVGGGTNGTAIVGQGAGTGYGLSCLGGSNGVGIRGEGQSAKNGVEGIGGPSGGIGVSGEGGVGGTGVRGTGGSSGGIGVQGIGSSGYAVVATGDITSPQYAALRIVPQDTDPSSPSKGDIYVNSGSGKLMIYTGAAWVVVGTQS